MTEKNNEEKAMSKKIKAAIIGSGNIKVIGRVSLKSLLSSRR